MSQKIKSGYKLSDIGPIPENWEAKQIGDLVKFEGGSQPPRDTFIFEPKEGYVRLIQIRDYKTDKYKTYVPLKLARKFCDDKDVMIGRYGPPIFQILRGIKGAYNVALIKAVPDELVIKDYLYYFLKQEPLFNLIDSLSQRTSGQTGIDMEALKAYGFPLPPKDEQVKIVEILDTIEKGINKTETIIDQTEKVKKGLMQILLTRGIGHMNFKKSEIGEIPEEWECLPLSKLLKIQGGYAFKSKDSSEKGIRWLKIANVGMGEVEWDDISFLPSEFAQQHPEFVLKTNDIVMAMTRPIIRNETKVARVTKKDVPSILNQRVGRFQLKEGLISEYFYHFLRSRYFANEILLKIAGTDPPNVSGKQIESILIALPSVEEQKKISEILSVYDNKLENERHRLTQLQLVKKGLMQVLLTGKVRVKVDKEEVITS